MRIHVAAAAAALIAPVGGMAQQTCTDHATMVERLAAGYGEARTAMGLAGGAVLEVFVSAETGTWTITVTQPGGPTCMVAAGQAWDEADDPLPPAGEEG